MNNADSTIEEATAMLEGRVGPDGTWEEASQSDQKKGFLLLLPLAESGNQVAQLQIGKCYLEGIGTTRNEEAGIEWLEKPAQKGFDEAQFELGEYYLNLYQEYIDRRPQILDLAFKWMKMAADQGYWCATLNDHWKNCTLEYQQACEREFGEILASAEAGDPGAQRMIHFHYHSGYGVKRSDEKAAYWLAEFEKNKASYLEVLKKKAENGDEQAGLEYDALTTPSLLNNPEAFLGDE
jgi:TPR repeat protein